MEKIFSRAISLFMTFTLIISCSSPRLTGLKCEFQEKPLALDQTELRFNWAYESENDDFCQKKVWLLISDDPENLEPDLISKDNTSGRMIGISGPQQQVTVSLEDYLKSYGTYWWKVIAEDVSGRKIFSSPCRFETSKLDESDWTASWISDGKDKGALPSPMFRKEFQVKGKVEAARLYVAAAGYDYVWLNGRRVGDRYLDPAYTHFDKRIYYATYDVTAYLETGTNAVASVVGNGWFNIQSMAVWHFDLAQWRDRPQLLCELRICYADGTVETIGTDASWKCNEGPYRFNNLYSGEIFDARLDDASWTTAAFDDSGWNQAVAVAAPTASLKSDFFEPIRICRTLEPVSMVANTDSTVLFDFGENIAGFTDIHVSGKAGTEVKVRYAEKLADDGGLDVKNISRFFHKGSEVIYKPVEDEAFQTDKIILSGEGRDDFHPLFSYKGFQYAEIEASAPVQLSKEDVEAFFIHTDLRQIGSFNCSDDRLNRLWKATNQTYLANFHSIPTDCPQREKNGWTADAWVATDLGLLNFDGISIYEKWMYDFADNILEDGRIAPIVPCNLSWGYDRDSGPVWDAAMFIIPYAVYAYYGDARAIEIVYDACVKHLEWLRTREEDGRINYGIGDHVFFKTKTPIGLTSSCFYYYMNCLMAEFSDILGKEDDGFYRKEAARIRGRINEDFFDAATASYGNGSMTSLAVPLYLKIVPEEYEDDVVAALVDKIRSNDHKIDFGVLGSRTVVRVLSDHGYIEDAYKMVVQPEMPGWTWWMEQGMTTLPEQWVIDAQKGGASRSHVFLGDISAWMYRYISGINVDYDHPGFTHFNIAPNFVDGLDWAEAQYESVKGMVKTSWKRRSGNKVILKVTVPPNTTATVTCAGTVKELSGGQHKLEFEVK